MSTTTQSGTDRAPDLERALDLIERGRRAAPSERALLVGVSGIDGAGKGFIADQLRDRLCARGWKVALIGADPLQNPLTIRLSDTQPARHFYDHVFRWQELFDRVIDPLAATRRLDVRVDGVRTDVDEYYPVHYAFADVDIVVLEGIFLFKRAFAWRFDVKLWVDCTFETALARAHARNQENQPPALIERDYRRTYHAAQRLHFELDDPLSRADAIVVNDPLLAASPAQRVSPQREAAP